MRRVDPAVSLGTLAGRVQVSSLTPDIVAIGAQGTTAAQAQDIANAVADSFISYISSPGIPDARVLEPATSATGTPLPMRLLVNGGLGALLGALAGAIAAVAIGRNDRRLQERDEIADAIGVPVLASIPVGHPSDAAGWTKLLDGYEPGVVHAWSLRKALHHLGLTDFRRDQPRHGEGEAAAAPLSPSFRFPATREHSPSALSWQSSLPPWGFPRRWSSAPSRTRTPPPRCAPRALRRRPSHRDARAICGSPSQMTKTSTGSQAPR